MNPIPAITTASDIQMDYMKLLVTELQNQDPLEPLDNKEIASQLAQLSQLQQLEAMNSSFARVLNSIERAYAGSLIGREISFPVKTPSGATEAQSGTVEQVYNDVDGQIILAVNGLTVGLGEVMSVKN